MSFFRRKSLFLKGEAYEISKVGGHFVITVSKNEGGFSASPCLRAFPNIYEPVKVIYLSNLKFSIVFKLWSLTSISSLIIGTVVVRVQFK